MCRCFLLSFPRKIVDTITCRITSIRMFVKHTKTAMALRRHFPATLETTGRPRQESIY